MGYTYAFDGKKRYALPFHNLIVGTSTNDLKNDWWLLWSEAVLFKFLETLSWRTKKVWLYWFVDHILILMWYIFCSRYIKTHGKKVQEELQRDIAAGRFV